MTDTEPLMNKRDWADEAKGMLKAELKRRNMTYANLVEALDAVGVKETEVNLRNKISRGNFSAAFFLQALDAIGCTLVPAVPTGMQVLRGRARGVRSDLWRKSAKAMEDKAED